MLKYLYLLPSIFILFLGLLSNNKIVARQTSSSNLKMAYIDKEVKNASLISKNLVNTYKEHFHLFTHGRMGELLVEGKWLSVHEIVDWLQEKNFLQQGQNQLNIYGCEFAKGEKGRTAVAYLEETLGICIAASNDITGIDGDWELEAGHSANHLFIEDYAYNLQETLPNDLPWNGSSCNGTDIMLQNGIGAISCGVTTATANADQWSFGLVNYDNIIPTIGRSDETAQAATYHHPSWHIDSIGNVYGIAMNTTNGCIFTTASSNYAVGFLSNQGIIRYGAIGGGSNSANNDFAAGGVVYKIDGTTGQASIFSILPQQSTDFTHQDCEGGDTQSRTNSGVGLGNIVYDETNNQYFVSNIEDGRIYRLSNAGVILDSYDPFDYDDGAAGISDLEELVYGLALEPGTNRLFFGGVDFASGSGAQPGSPGIYSLQLTTTGGFPGTIDNTNMPSGATYDNYVNGPDIFHTTIPTGSGNSFIDDYVYHISDLAFNANGDLIAGVRVGCNESFFTSYNHWGEMNIITMDAGTALYNDSVTELDISFTGSAGPEDGYGGVATYTDTNNNNIIAASYADVLTEPGPHGIAIFSDPPNSGSVSPLAAVAYGVSGDDPKGVGGDVEIWGACKSVDICTNPTATAYALAASCTNDTPNNDGYLQISVASDATHYNFVMGSDYTSGDADIANATAFDPATDLPLQFGTLANPAGSQDYTIRVFNGASDCFTDTTVTLEEQTCVAGCSCAEYLYLNDTGTGEVHKFGVNTDGSIYEIGSPWMSGFNQPHGLGNDINGFLYIGDAVTGPIYQVTCNGGTVANDATLWNSNFNDGVTNIGSYGGYIFINGTTADGEVNASEIGVVDPCTGDLVGTICLDGFVWGNWGLQVLPDGKIVATAGANWGDGNRAVYIFDFDESLINNTNCIQPLVAGSYLDNYDGLYGITYDGTHLYIVTLEDGTSQLTLLKIDATTGTLVQAQPEGGWNSSGYNGAQGLVYSETSGMLYVAGYEDCVSIVDPADLSYVGPGNGAVATGELPKAIAKQSECCPTPNRQVLDQTFCLSGSNDQLFLNDLFPCNGGVICEGQWTPADPASTAVYNSCDQSISAGIAPGCYKFTKGSDGLENYPKCGAFQLDFNLEILDAPTIDVSADETVCSGGTTTLSITTTTTSIQWQMSTDGCAGTFTDIAGATSTTYAPPALTDTTYYRAIVNVNGNCSTGTCPFESTCITINVDPNCTSSCTMPTVTASASAASCTNDIPNDDGYLQISAATDATHYNYIMGSDYAGGDADMTNATAFDPAADLPLQFGTLANPTGSQDYTIRVFNGASDCFTDITVTLQEQSCVPITDNYDVSLEKTVDLAIAPLNSTVTFTIAIANNGSAVTGAIVTDLLPAGLSYDGTSYVASVGTFDGTTWTIGNMAVGATETLDITVTVVAVGVHRNEASITINETEDDLTNNDDEACVSVLIEICNDGSQSVDATAEDVNGDGTTIYQWYASNDNGANYTPIDAANGGDAQTYQIIQAGYYIYTVNGGTLGNCDDQLCCPIIVTTTTCNACPPVLCLPVTLTIIE